MSALEQRFAEFGVAFLTAGRVAADLPAASVLPFRTSFQSGDRPKPCVVLHCAGIESRGNRRNVPLVLDAVVLCNHKDTPEATEREWSGKIRKLFANADAWRTFFAGLTEEQRTGYRILRFALRSTNSFDPDTEQRDFTTSITFHLYTTELLG